jgi:hypothetical protein
MRAWSLRCSILLLIMSVGASTSRAQTSDRADGMRFVPDVSGQFRAFTERPEALGINISTTPDPSTCKHYQAITRVDRRADGMPFFFVTRSGSVPDIAGPLSGVVCNDSPGETDNGHLIVFQMGSRNKSGERMRSNRLRKGVHVDGTQPSLADIATIYYTVVEGGLVFRDGEGGVRPPRVYQHPGGMQLVGHMLAVAMDGPYVGFFEGEGGYETASDPSQVMFFDVSDPESPVFKSRFVPTKQDGQALNDADGIGITPLPGGRYLMSINSGFTGRPIIFYRSTIANSAEVPNVLESPDLSWEYVGETPGPAVENAHQSFQFLRQGNVDGPLFLAGARGYYPGSSYDNDRIDLYRVICAFPDCTPGGTITLVPEWQGRRITPFPNTGGNELADLAAASGFHVTPSGELLFYATLHDTEGPGGTVNAGEWRHVDVVRDNSSTYLPTAVVNGPYEVDEGRNVDLSGSAKPAATKAWIELFHATLFGGADFATYYPVVDYDDYELDDFDVFNTLESLSWLGEVYFHHADKAQSLKWFAPVGCSIRVMDYAGGNPDNFVEDRTLIGDGALHSDPNLSDDDQIQNINQKIDAVDFLENCDDYYQAVLNLQWDLDVNGSYEEAGDTVTFNAIAFDGPSEVAVPAQAQHPSGGAAGQATARITVHNVAPELSAFRLTDAAGNVVNGDVPFVLTGLPVTLAADFGDPGVLDHQTAALDWGDDSVESETAFTTFDEAFGDATGAVSHTHTYTVAGSHPMALSVTDDDGGVDTESALVRVLTPEQAVEELIDLLTGIIAGTPSGKVRKDLEKALKALTGTARSDGALNQIKKGNDDAAIAFLGEALNRLQDALAGGADVAVLIALVEQVTAALSLS